MRGKLVESGSTSWAIRNIPAYAGKTERLRGQCWGLAEHPRVCGENSRRSSAVFSSLGTSPRMRGKLAFGVFGASEWRNIPAYAGKTAFWCPRRRLGREHPRVCGENLRRTNVIWPSLGTSPRMRGKLLHDFEGGKVLRNIPAYAGKTC